MIEVEKRSFITKDKYNELITYFKNENYNLVEEKQITTYFNGDIDFRLMKTPSYLKLWLKKGKLHDDAREEIEVIVDTEYKDSLSKMLMALGYETSIKWYRTRVSFKYEDFAVTIDYSVGYGYIIEFELLVDSEEKVESSKERISKMFSDFNIDETPKTIFEDAYSDYKINWREYTRDIDDNKLLND